MAHYAIGVRNPDGTYSDIPSPAYPEIGAPLGWPTNPCTK